jgi:hypothetical protein
MAGKDGSRLKTILLLIALSLACALTTGCTHTTYGARERKINIDTAPPGGTVYIVPNEIWLNYDNKQDLLGSGQLDQYKKGQAPITVELMPYHWIVVAKWTNPPKTYWQGYKPAEDGSLLLDPSSPAAESGQ